MGYGDFSCPTCGSDFTKGFANQMAAFKPEIRAERIGDHHARDNWAYLWCAPEFTREELRGYARGFLSAAYTTRNSSAVWLYEAQAKQDAYGRD
jgi:hypothetical protein